MLVRPDGTTERSLGDAAADAAAAAAAGELLARERSEIRELAPGVRAFVEVLEPPLRLLVCGAGHDAAPLVKQAAALGWSPIVVDDRPEFLNRERFPEAADFVLVERPDKMAEVAPVDNRTHVVVMTHNFLRDKEYVRSLVGSPARFIEMLGPRVRTERLFAELREEGLDLPDATLARFRTPAGLDLGAEGPDEIAAAICAEIVAVRHGRGAGFLRDRPGPIHDRA
jgi:xanthine dehydrogenase accessory factor